MPTHLRLYLGSVELQCIEQKEPVLNLTEMRFSVWFYLKIQFYQNMADV